MKTFTQFVAIASLMMVGCGRSEESKVSAAKLSAQSELVAALTELNIDKNLGIGTAYGASVTIFKPAQSISVHITTCPPSALCSTPGPVYTAKIMKQSKDGCGVITTFASTDKRPVDGALTEIRVTDTSKSLCEIIYPFSTKVELTTKIVSRRTGIEGSTYSVMTGNEVLH